MWICKLYYNVFAGEQTHTKGSNTVVNHDRQKETRKQQIISFPTPTGECSPPIHDPFNHGLHNITESSRLWPGLQTPLIPDQFSVPGLCWNPRWSLLHLSWPVGVIGACPPPNDILRGLLFMLPDTLNAFWHLSCRNVQGFDIYK